MKSSRLWETSRDPYLSAIRFGIGPHTSTLSTPNFDSCLPEASSNSHGPYSPTLPSLWAPIRVAIDPVYADLFQLSWTPIPSSTLSIGQLDGDSPLPSPGKG